MAKAKSAQPAVSTVGAANDFSKLKDVADSINKKVGKKLVFTGDEIPQVFKVPFEEPALDHVADGGIPLGRFTEFLGQEHSGKTRAALRAMSRFQKYCYNCNEPGVLDVVWKKNAKFPEVESCTCHKCGDAGETRVSLFVDVEGTTDRKFMRRLGVDTDGVIYLRPDQPADAADVIETYLRTVGIGLIVLDSFGVMGGTKETNTPIGDINMNQNAVWFNMMFRKFQAAMNASFNESGGKDTVTCIIINQSYVTLNMYSTEVPQGGRGLRHGKGLSLKFKTLEKNKDKDDVVHGVHVRIENMKNKTGMPYRRAEFYLNLDPADPELKYGETNVLSQYVDLGIKFEVIEQSGAWYTIGGQRYQGKANLSDALAAEPDLLAAIDKELYGK